MENNDPIDFHQFRANVKKKRFENKKFFDNAQRKRPKDIDELIQNLDKEVFEKTDCLKCGNCCKTTPSMINQHDISRISKYLGISKGDFTEKYVTFDNDDDMVYRHTPCAFLGEDNACQIYDVRPKACREYPHTDMHKINLTIMRENIAVCPAVYEITEKLKRAYIDALKLK